jgi:hypothetical protein
MLFVLQSQAIETGRILQAFQKLTTHKKYGQSNAFNMARILRQLPIQLKERANPTKKLKI